MPKVNIISDTVLQINDCVILSLIDKTKENDTKQKYVGKVVASESSRIVLTYSLVPKIIPVFETQLNVAGKKQLSEETLFNGSEDDNLSYVKWMANAYSPDKPIYDDKRNSLTCSKKQVVDGMKTDWNDDLFVKNYLLYESEQFFVMIGVIYR